MRALATISAVTLLSAGLAGCDMPGSQQQQAAVAPPPATAPTTTPATVTPPPDPNEHLARLSYAPQHSYVRHRHYTAARYRSHDENNRSQQSVDAYNYVSSSSVTRSSYSESSYGSGQIVWVDGYGRGYFNNGPVTVAATMRGQRLAPYHGYNVDCPEDGEPR
jgi:hypothetical protein